mgnify:CR=1 FL=1
MLALGQKEEQHEDHDYSFFRMLFSAVDWSPLPPVAPAFVFAISVLLPAMQLCLSGDFYLRVQHVEKHRCISAKNSVLT